MRFVQRGIFDSMMFQFKRFPGVFTSHLTSQFYSDWSYLTLSHRSIKKVEPEQQDEQDESYCEIERIRSAKLVRGKRQFLVCWKGKSPHCNRWISEDNIMISKTVLDKIWDSFQKQNQPKEKNNKEPKLRKRLKKRQ